MAQIAQAFKGHSVWYQVDNLDYDPSVFIRHLVSGITHACDLNAVRTNSCINETSDFIRDGESILAILLDELGQQTQKPLLICFDDFHLFDKTSQTPRLVDYLVKNLPENLSLIIASRIAPTLALGRLRAQGVVCDFGEQDLQFSHDELSELMNEWEIEASATNLRQAYKSTEGWAAGLVLTESYLRSGNEAPHIFKKRHMQQSVYEYLAEEVLNDQTEKTKEVLMYTALINPIDPEICSTALGIKDIERVLERAVQNNIFTTRLKHANLYRYHPLFREFLLSKLNTILSFEKMNQVRICFAEALAGEKKFEEAINQYIAAGEKLEARKIIEFSGDSYLKKGENKVLLKWFEELGKDHGSIIIEILTARILIIEGRVLDAMDILRTVKTKLGKQDIQVRYDYSIAYAACMRDLNKLNEAVEELEKLLSFELTPEMRLETLQLLGINYRSLSDKKGVETCSILARNIETDIFLKLKENHREILKSMECFCKGNFVEAYETTKKVLNNENLTLNLRCQYTNNLACALMIRGHYAEARTIAVDNLSVVRRKGLDKYLPSILDNVGCLFIAQGDIKEGIAFLKSAVEVDSSFGYENVEICAPLCHMGSLARRRDKPEEAYEKHYECLRIAKKHGENYDRVIAMTSLGADLLRLADLVEAKKYLNKARKQAIEYDYGYALTQINFNFAWLAFLEDDRVGMNKNLRAALMRAKKHEQNHYLIQEARISIPLFTYALEQQIEPDYTLCILEKIGESALNAIEPLLKHESVAIRNRIARLLGKMNTAGALTLLRRLRNDSDDEVKKIARDSIVKLRKNNLEEVLHMLSSREMEVLVLVSKGLSNKEIASNLFISDCTVKTHITKIFRKLGFTNRIDAALYYLEYAEINKTF